jgi:hypothetical protein
LPLPPSVARDELHLRRIEVRGYHRHDGLYDIEARITDTKTDDLQLSEKSLPAGALLHDMWLRLVVDENLTVHDVVASIEASPFRICPGAVESLAAIKGLRIGAGWSRAVKERLARADNCAHLVELLAPLATTAYQTLAPLFHSQPERVDKNGRPLKVDSCYAYAAKREVAMRRWPEFYEGPAVD